MIKLLDILENKILVARRPKEERQKAYTRLLTTKIKQYIQSGGKGNLDLRELRESLPILKDLKKVGGNLHLSNITSIPQGFSPTVEGSFYVESLTSIPQGFNPIVGGNLYLSNITSIPQGFNPIVGGGLSFLKNVTSIPKTFNPTVGGNLLLLNNTSVPEGWNPTNVRGSIYLKNGEYKLSKAKPH